MTLAELREPAFTAQRLIAAGMSEAEAIAKGERFALAASMLGDSGEAVAVFVPGRLEVLGKHTDYCGGRSLLCAVERGMCFVATPRPDASIEFLAIDRNGRAALGLDPNLAPTPAHWSTYPMTVARRIARNFPGTTGSALRGASIAMTSDLPAASGLSSSSAMIVGTFLVLSAINDLQSHEAYRANLPSLEALAGYLGCIENGQSFGTLAGDRGVGTFGGSQDHTAILCCKPGRLSVYSFCPVRHEKDVALPDDLRFVIADSGVIAEKTGAALSNYNRVSRRARQLVELWNSAGGRASCLREALESSPDAERTLRRLIDQHPQLEREHALCSRLDQFMSESCSIIPDAVEAIERRDFDRFGQATDQSQRLAERELQNQVTETTALQRSLRAQGALAASAFGAGFGGSVWGLFRAGALPDLASHFVTLPGIAATLL